MVGILLRIRIIEEARYILPVVTCQAIVRICRKKSPGNEANYYIRFVEYPKFSSSRKVYEYFKTLFCYHQQNPSSSFTHVRCSFKVMIFAKHCFVLVLSIFLLCLPLILYFLKISDTSSAFGAVYSMNIRALIERVYASIDEIIYNFVLTAKMEG